MLNNLLKLSLWGVAVFGMYLATYGSYSLWERGSAWMSGFVLLSGFFITVVCVYSYLEFKNDLEKK